MIFTTALNLGEMDVFVYPSVNAELNFVGKVHQMGMERFIGLSEIDACLTFLNLLVNNEAFSNVKFVESFQIKHELSFNIFGSSSLFPFIELLAFDITHKQPSVLTKIT